MGTSFDEMNCNGMSSHQKNSGFQRPTLGDVLSSEWMRSPFHYFLFKQS